MTDIARAVLGMKQADDIRALLMQTGFEAFRRMAGYIPSLSEAETTTPGKGYLLDAIEQNPVDDVAAWVGDRGWVAGGAALWRLLYPAATWSYGDIDVFCTSESAFDSLKFGCYSIEQEHGRSIVAAVKIRVNDEADFYTRKVNIVYPSPEQDWTDPTKLIAEFDLSPCAVVMIAPRLVYAAYPEDIEAQRLRYLGDGRGHLRLFQRFIKYHRRGFKADSDFFNDVYQDEAMRPLVHFMEDLYDILISGDRRQDLQQIALEACWAIPDGDECDDSGEEYEAYEDWY